MSKLFINEDKVSPRDLYMHIILEANRHTIRKDVHIVAVKVSSAVCMILESLPEFELIPQSGVVTLTAAVECKVGRIGARYDVIRNFKFNYEDIVLVDADGNEVFASPFEGTKKSNDKKDDRKNEKRIHETKF